jgi:hypothetical protein
MMESTAFPNRTETLVHLTMSLRALVLTVARYSVERRGGAVTTNPESFGLNCTGIPISEQDACREEVEELFMSLRRSIAFQLEAPEQNVSRS